MIKRIDSSPGSFIEDQDMPHATGQALLAKKMIEECSRLYFGPRSLRYRLTDAGKQWIKDNE